MSKETIYDTIEDANNALGKCPRPLAGSGGYHWWLIDSDVEEARAMEDGGDANTVACICKTCERKMLLSADADEYPSV